MWQINNDIFSPSPKTGHSSFSFPFLDIYYFWCTVYSLPCEDCSCGAQALECVGFSSWRISSLAVVCVLSCPLRMWDLSSPIRDQTHIPYIGRWLLNYWATKEVPRYSSSDEHLKKKKNQQIYMWILSSNLLFQRNMFFVMILWFSFICVSSKVCYMFEGPVWFWNYRKIRP